MMQSQVADPEKDVIMLDPFRLDGEVVSSSAIRTHLEAARIDQANRLLGRPFSYSGQVVRGEGRGNGLGFPTANLDLGYPYKAMVAYGVYAGKASFQGRSCSAVANIGINPTFSGPGIAQGQKIEVHILDFKGDIYGQTLEFTLESHIRPEKKFASVKDLRQQIALDVAEARVRLNG